MTANEILQFFLQKANWFDKTQTVDKIIIGEESKEVNSILVTWMVHDDTVDYAVRHGYDMIMTHEPTFWFHSGELYNIFIGEQTSPKIKTANEKAKKILNQGIVIMRNHDVWDRFPEIGIPFEFARQLGIEAEPFLSMQNGYMHRYDIQPILYGDFVQQVANACARLGEEGIQVFGDSQKMVKKIGIGTGCCCDLEAFYQSECDVAIICDDGQVYWRDISWAMEVGMSIIRVNHGTSEEAGMRTLAKYVRDELHIKSEYYPHRQGFHIVHSK